MLSSTKLRSRPRTACRWSLTGRARYAEMPRSVCDERHQLHFWYRLETCLAGRLTMLGWLLQTDGTLVPLLLRLTLAIVMFPHGAQKVLGWFGGHGFKATMDS